MSAKQRLVVIGNGMAGARFVEEVVARDGGERYAVTVFGAEPYGNYNRILLSGVLAGTHDPQDIFINPLQWYAEHGVTLHAGSPVSRIDLAARCVYASDGVMEPYERLVIATGSKPFIPRMDNLYHGDALRSGVFAFRTLDDCDAITRHAASVSKVAVIGGGLLGLEAARGLLNYGLEVHLVHLMPYLMETQLDESSGAILQDTLMQMGVRLYMSKRTTAILGDDRVTGLAFDDGSTLDCDMVVISAGIAPNVQVARDAGLTVERGIVVGDDLACSAPNIYAIGECAQHRGMVYGLVAPLWEQARCLADHLTEQKPDARYHGSRISTKLKVMGVELAVMGSKADVNAQDEVVTYVEPSRGIYKKLVIRDERLAGAIIMGDSPTTPRLVQLFARGEKLPKNRAELLFPLESNSRATIDVTDMPDDAQICNCNGVAKGAIVAAVKAGKRSLPTLCAATRAGTGCGTCKSQVQAILEATAGDDIVDDPATHYYVPGVPLTKPQLIAAIKEKHLRSVSAVFAALADNKEDPGSKAGLASLLKTIWGKGYEDERDARFINDRVHANIQRDGTFSVVPRMYGGVTSAAELKRIAEVAERHNVPMIKLTGGQRIDLLGVTKAQLPAIWQDLGMPSGHAYTKAFRTCKTCVGSEFCRFGVGDSTALGVSIEKRFQGIESPHKMKLAVSGCPRNCAESTTKDVGVVAIEGGKWEIYIGGAAGSRVRKGDVLCTVDSHDDALRYIGRFMQYYRENAKYMERTYDFVERVSIETLRKVLVDDSEGICQRLDDDMQASIDAYQDPWEEAAQPATPNQFAETLAAAVMA